MQGGRDPFFGFGDPFGSFGGFGGQRSLMSSFFGGRDPFDDPFFSRPFGSMLNSGPFGRMSNSGPFGSMANPSFFVPAVDPFMHPQFAIEHQPPQQELPRGPVIQELDSDDEVDDKAKREVAKNENPRKHGRSGKQPIVEEPDDETTVKKSRHVSHRNDLNSHTNHAMSHPQTNNFTFQSSTVSYGGANGAYYSSSRTRRTGSDGFTFEEYKEADSSTRQASHRISRGIHDKGHSLSRKLKSDGQVETMQTLHNLHEHEVGGFEEAWNGNAGKFLPGWNQEHGTQHIAGHGSGGQRGPSMGSRLALPSAAAAAASLSLQRSNDDGGMMKQEAGNRGARVKSNVGGSNFNNPSKKR